MMMIDPTENEKEHLPTSSANCYCQTLCYAI